MIMVVLEEGKSRPVGMVTGRYHGDTQCCCAEYIIMHVLFVHILSVYIADIPAV